MDDPPVAPIRRAQDPLRALAHRASEGEAAAIRELIMELGGPMLRTVRKVLGAGHPDAEDVAQEAVMGLITSLKNFRGDCSVAHFAHQVALRRALHARRHFKNRDKLGDQELAPEGPSDAGAGSPLGNAISRERRRVVHALLDELSEPTAEALALHFMLGYSVSEIASALEVPQNTVWSRLKLGKKAMKKGLDDDEKLRELLQGELP
jgi:RNA polymerase sigma-70 factor (ECF subfamily)